MGNKRSKELSCNQSKPIHKQLITFNVVELLLYWERSIKMMQNRKSERLAAQISLDGFPTHGVFSQLRWSRLPAECCRCSSVDCNVNRKPLRDAGPFTGKGRTLSGRDEKVFLTF